MRDAASLAALLAPYRHAGLPAVKLAGEPNNASRIKDHATAHELRAEVTRRITDLSSAAFLIRGARGAQGDELTSVQWFGF